MFGIAAAKKKSHDKLTAPLDENETEGEVAVEGGTSNIADEYWDGDDYWTNDPLATPSPSPFVSTSENGGSGIPTMSPAAAVGNETDSLIEARMGDTLEGDALNVDIQTTQVLEAVPYGVQASKRESTVRTPTSITSPKVQRELFPDPVKLKAHSSVHLRTHDSKFFAETTNFLTPCLQIAYPTQLQAYKLTIDYSDGPDASSRGVVISNMNIQVVVSVITDSIDALKSVTNENASKVIHECFDGPQLYNFLGSLRREGVEINEIEFQGRPFKSPIFSRSEPVGVISNNAPEKPKRAGLISSLIVLMVIVATVFLAHRRGKLPKVQLPVIRLGQFAGSIRKSFQGDKLGSMREGMNSSFSSSHDQGMVSGLSSSEISSFGSTGGGSHQTPAVRERTWSGSLRRHPPGGIKAAALQKKPAFSSDFLKTPKSEYTSYSVQGDYDVPEEYDFQATPISTMTASAKLHPNLALSNLSKASSSKTEDEFGMPDDYNTVHEDVSLYSASASASAMSGVGNNNRYPHHHKTASTTTPSVISQSALSRITIPIHAAVAASGLLLGSPTTSNDSSTTPDSSVRDDEQQMYADEWSMASFQTSSLSVGLDPTYHRHHLRAGGAAPGTRPVVVARATATARTTPSAATSSTSASTVAAMSTSTAATTTTTTTTVQDDSTQPPPPPYRGWNGKANGSPGSQLAMPNLSFV